MEIDNQLTHEEISGNLDGKIVTRKRSLRFVLPLLYATLATPLLSACSLFPQVSSDVSQEICQQRASIINKGKADIQRQLPFNSSKFRDIVAVSYSPDNTLVAFVNDNDVFRLYVSNLNGADVKMIADQEFGNFGTVSWTPDSQYISYDRSEEGSGERYTHLVWAKKRPDFNLEYKVSDNC